MDMVIVGGQSSSDQKQYREKDGILRGKLNDDALIQDCIIIIYQQGKLKKGFQIMTECEK